MNTTFELAIVKSVTEWLSEGGKRNKSLRKMTEKNKLSPDY